VVDFLERWMIATWSLVIDSGAWLLFGLVLASVISLLLHKRNLSRLIMGNGRSDILRAALLGIPLPLCSCSVLPVAYQLRRSGVSRAATTAFLISTPESGVDSIMLTYSLTDPLMTVARPISAFATAATAGLVESLIGTTDHAQIASSEVSCESPECNCGTNVGEGANRSETSWVQLRKSFSDMADDLAPSLAIGYLLAGLIALVTGGDMLQIPEILRTGWGGYVGALIIGVPLYVCATSSTPLAASLLVAGFSPGAILVFLLVGPATNAASLTVIRKILSGWSVVRYLASILIVAVVCGLVTDWLYDSLGIIAKYHTSEGGEHVSWFAMGCAALIVGLIIWKLANRLLGHRT